MAPLALPAPPPAGLLGRLAGFVVAAIVVIPAVGSGQVLTTVEFSFSNPGARSMGFGGAFVALADDATAAFANPAGLIQLAEPEVSIEARFWHYESPYTSGGRGAGSPTGLGIDTVPDPLHARSTADLAGLSFLSLVYPLNKWSFAIYQHQLLNFEMTQEIQGIFVPGSVVAGTERGPIERAFFDFELTSRALAAGYRLGDRLSLGVALSYFDPATHFIGDEYLPADAATESYFAAASFLPERLSHHIRVETMGGNWGLTAGALWRASRQWKVGGVYRQGARLDLRAGLIAGPVHPELSAGQVVSLGRFSWRLPDVYGFGASYRSRDGRWTGACEWNRVEYSTLVESMPPEYTVGGTLLEDADELHLGGEYAFFAGTSVVAIRMGVWRDPDHLVQNVGDSLLARAEHPPGSDESHVAIGLGVVHDRLQLDLGIDLSERRNAASVSAIYGL